MNKQKQKQSNIVPGLKTSNLSKDLKKTAELDCQKKFVSKVEKLNEDFTKWTVESTLDNRSCVLIPGFEDYANHLKLLQEEKNLKLKVMKLNREFSDWIKKNVEKNPLCHLSPPFIDYVTQLEMLRGRLKRVFENQQGEPKLDSN